MAGPQGRDQQTEVRKDWREEAEHADQGVGGGVPWCVERVLLAACSCISSSLVEKLELTRSVDDADEFAIYLNYVRKLGFEETPDYDFLRELFSKVLKNMGESDDGVYDWMLLNNGKGWEAGVRWRSLSVVCSAFSRAPC